MQIYNSDHNGILSSTSPFHLPHHFAGVYITNTRTKMLDALVQGISNAVVLENIFIFEERGEETHEEEGQADEELGGLAPRYIDYFDIKYMLKEIFRYLHPPLYRYHC